MLPKACVVEGRRGLFTADAVRAYRHYGLLLVRDFLPPGPLHQLTALCNETARRRGEAIFPGVDPQHQHGASTGLKAQLHTNARPSSTDGMSASPSTAGDAAAAAAAPPQATSSPVVSDMAFGSGAFPPDVVAKAAASDRERGFDMQTQKVHLNFKHQRAVDKAFSRLTKARNRYNAYKNIRKHVTEEEELAGDMSDERIREVTKQYSYDDLKRGFQNYRDSGKLEKEIRHEHHVDDAMRFMQNWPRTWAWLSQSSPALRALAMSADGDVGRRVGDAAGHLSGEVLLRVFCDSAVQTSLLTNGISIGCAGLGANFAHPQALNVQLGLSLSSSDDVSSLARQVAMPGSHHVVRRISLDGKEMERFTSGGVFDMGSVVRRIPELHHLPMVELPPLAPGSALFVNQYLMMGVLPTLAGPAQGAAASPEVHVANYALSLMPDRCVFDGQRTSWASRDTHGPLYTYKRGDLLTDDATFPVIHRALDIE